MQDDDRADCSDLPSALDRMNEILGLASGRAPVLFLDYDGTLTPIVERPERAVLSTGMRRHIAAAAARFPVAVISGRDLPNVKRLVGVDGLTFAGSHGFDIEVPGRGRIAHRIGEEFPPLLDGAERDLEKSLRGIAGAQVERKAFTIAVHYRRVHEHRRGDVEEAVNRVLSSRERLRRKEGKMVFEIQPAVDWDKGKAVLWLLDELDRGGGESFPIYIGDDLTDEDAFRALAGRGVGIIVRDESRPTAAAYALESTIETEEFIRRLTAAVPGGQMGDPPGEDG